MRPPTENALMLRSKRQSGQALVAATFGLVALIGATGLAIDMGYLRYQKRLQQSAADSAALAGAAETGFGGDVTAAAQQDSLLNGFTDGANNVTVTVNPNYQGHANAVEVLVSAVQPTFFMKIFGVNTATVTSRAVAQFSGNGIKNCIYALGRGGSIDNDQTISAPSCGIISNGDFFTGGGRVTAASIGVVGSADTNNINPTPVTGIVAAADPLSYLRAPASGGACKDGTLTSPPPPGGGGRRRRPPPQARFTLTPGLYCSITVTGNVDLTLSPGTYVLATGGKISFGGTGTVTGSNVTFYLSSGATGGVTLGNGVTFDLTAPTAGPYTGILFFQDAANASAATIDGTNASKLQGAFYFPSAMLTVNGAAANAAYMIFVAQSMELNATVNLPSNYSSLTGGSPIKNAVLVE